MKDSRLNSLDRRISEVKTFLNASAADIARLNGLEVDVIVRCGIPHLVIADTAREQAVDLIVMGAHQKDAWRDLFSNTTIERVLRERCRSRAAGQ